VRNIHVLYCVYVIHEYFKLLMYRNVSFFYLFIPVAILGLKKQHQVLTIELFPSWSTILHEPYFTSHYEHSSGISLYKHFIMNILSKPRKDLAKNDSTVIHNYMCMNIEGDFSLPLWTISALSYVSFLMDNELYPSIDMKIKDICHRDKYRWGKVGLNLWLARYTLTK